MNNNTNNTNHVNIDSVLLTIFNHYESRNRELRQILYARGFTGYFILNIRRPHNTTYNLWLDVLDVIDENQAILRLF